MNACRSPGTLGFLPWVMALSLVSAAAHPVVAHENKHHPTAGGTKAYEVRFLKQMIDHHMMAIDMGKECGERATHQELKDLCQSISTSQAAEITTMQDWLKTWYGITYGGKSMAMKGMGAALSTMQGREYEIAFLQRMNQHHKMAVRMARECRTRGRHAELKAMCNTIVDTQTREVKQMTTWLCEWYQKCAPGRK